MGAKTGEECLFCPQLRRVEALVEALDSTVTEVA